MAIEAPPETREIHDWVEFETESALSMVRLDAVVDQQGQVMQFQNDITYDAYYKDDERFMPFTQAGITVHYTENRDAEDEDSGRMYIEAAELNQAIQKGLVIRIIQHDGQQKLTIGNVEQQPTDTVKHGIGTTQSTVRDAVKGIEIGF